MQSAVAREGLQDDDFRLFSDNRYLPSQVRLVHVICALLAVSYLLIVVLFVTSSTHATKPPQQVKSNDTAVVLSAMKSSVQDALKSDYTTDLTKLRSEVQSSADGQRAIRDQISTLQNNIGTLTSKLTDLENSMKKDLPANPCGTGPETWEYYGGSCYLILNLKSNWMAAKMKCESKNATLAVITSEGEQNFLKSKTKDQRFWIGLTDVDEEQEWRWIDGTDYKSGIKFWKPGEPNDSNKNEDCAHLWINGEWNDVHCTYQCFALCEKKASTL
ncbi:hepatic lectin-like [Lissotriton helveticus]